LTAARQLLKTPLLALLGWPAFRRRVMFELQQRYYDEFSNMVPLGHGLQCPLTFREGWHSFAEIFVQGEYDRPFEQLPLPARWVDIGSHAGFFSLYVAWRRARAGCSDPGSALLLDADSRMAMPVGELLRVNGLTERFQFLHGMVACGEGDRAFRERAVMASSAAGIGASEGRCTSVPVVGAAEILARFPPPYDLVKIDIEGGEYDFVAAYEPVLNAATRILLEWHSWHPGGGGAVQILEELQRRGFSLTYSTAGVASPTVPGGETGLMLFVKSPTPGID
jgi:FkbM family methyltransferase